MRGSRKLTGQPGRALAVRVSSVVADNEDITKKKISLKFCCRIFILMLLKMARWQTTDVAGSKAVFLNYLSKAAINSRAKFVNVTRIS
jgi:hypothetical protein